MAGWVVIIFAACSSVGLDNSRVQSLDIQARKYCDEGMRLSGENKPDEAIRAFSKSIRIDPSVTAYSGRSAEYAGKGRIDDALSDMNSAILISPRYPPAYTRRGSIYFRKGDYDRAARDYLRAISLDPNHAEYYYNLALTYARLGRADEERGMYEKSVKTDQYYYPAQYNLACIYAQSNEHQKALDSLEKAVVGGFADAPRMKVEPALSGVRNSARFRALLKNIEIIIKSTIKQ